MIFFSPNFSFLSSLLIYLSDYYNTASAASLISIHRLLLRSEASSVPGVSGTHPLLAPCLNGIGKFAHLIDLDFMADLMQCLRKLAGNGSKLGDSSENSTRQLTVSERLHCCVVAFKVMRINLDALNVDLQEFFVQFYNLILEYRPGR